MSTVENMFPESDVDSWSEHSSFKWALAGVAGKLSLLLVSKVKCLLVISLGLYTAVWPNTPLSKPGTDTSTGVCVHGKLCITGLAWAEPPDRASVGV